MFGAVVHTVTIMTSSPAPLLRLRLASAVYRFRESLFALPALIVVAGVVLAEATALIDRTVTDADSAPWTVQMQANAATWLLSTVAGATITTAGVVFSLTVVSLQLASSQFSPRVMRSFIRDRFSQAVIGMLVATFVFCVLTLRHVTGDATAPAPSIAMTMSLVLTVATVMLIVAYLDRLAHRLQVGEVVRSITDETDAVIAATVYATEREASAGPIRFEELGDEVTVVAIRDGWVSQAPTDYILDAVPPSTVVRLETRPGAYIHRGEVLMRVRPAPPDTERTRARLLATVTIADARTMQQDFDFGLRQLLDIALRALSPAINDPTTAIEVVLRLGSLMRVVLVAPVQEMSVCGADGRVLVRPWLLSPEEYIEHAFDEIRRTCTGQVHVAMALIRVLRMLVQHVRDAGRPEHVPALERQIRMILDALVDRTDIHPEDLERVQAIARSAIDPAEHRLD